MNFLERLPSRWRARLLPLGEQQALEPGALLMAQGQTGGDIHLVEEGQLEVVDPSTSPPRIAAVLEPGQVVGELSFLDRAPRSLDVRARQASRVRSWSREALLAELASDPEFAAATYEALALVASNRVRVLDAVVNSQTRAHRPVDGEDDPVVDELAADLEEAWKRPSPERFTHVLRDLARTLAPLAGTQQGDQVARALARHLGPRLELARTAELLLHRLPGQPSTAELWAHLESGRPAGGTPTAEALDQALLDLPSLAAVRWRAHQHQALLGQQRLAVGDTIGLLAPAHPLLQEQLTRLASGLGARTLLLAQDDDGCLDVNALLSLCASGVPADLPPLRALVVEGPIEQLPDRLVGGLLRAAGQLLQPGGQVLLGSTLPAWDSALVDHLLGWPQLTRDAALLGNLLRGARSFGPAEEHHQHSDDPQQAPGLLLLAQRRAQP